jgi:hypothetical protein
MEKGLFIGQTTRSGQANRALLSRHNRCVHRLIVHVAGLAPVIRHGEDTLTGDMR